MRTIQFKFLHHILLSTLILFGCTKINPKQVDRQMPNILIIVADDLGWNDVSFHGSDIRTPTIDSLALNSTLLNRFYVAPKCSPTRAGLLTGKYPNRFGLRYGVCTPRAINGLPSEELTLPEILSKNGYNNRAAFGKWHLGHSNVKYHPLNHGFTYFYGHYNGAIDYFTRKRDAELDWHRNYEPVFEEGYSTELIGEDVIRYISDVKNDGPFFSYVAFNAPHAPMQAKERDLLEYGFDSTIVSDSFVVGGQQQGEREKEIYGMQGRGNSLRQTYSAMVSSMDRSIGSIVDYLKKEDLYDNTIIWFLSDNGATYYYGGDNSPLRGEKHQEWEGGVRSVSFVKLLPDQQTLEEVNQVVSYIDVLPTISSLVDKQKDMKVDGINVLPLLWGDSLSERYLYLGKDAVVSNKWKLINSQLFRIDLDMTESKDLSEEYPTIYQQLNNKLAEFNDLDVGEYTFQSEGWVPPENWKMPGNLASD